MENNGIEIETEKKMIQFIYQSSKQREGDGISLSVGTETDIEGIVHVPHENSKQQTEKRDSTAIKSSIGTKNILVNTKYAGAPRGKRKTTNRECLEMRIQKSLFCEGRKKAIDSFNWMKAKRRVSLVNRVLNISLSFISLPPTRHQPFFYVCTITSYIFQQINHGVKIGFILLFTKEDVFITTLNLIEMEIVICMVH